MKRYIIIVLSVMMLFLANCYLNNKDSSRVFLRTTPKPDVTALHVAVYDSSADDLLLYRVFKPTDIIDLDVPIGNDRVFVIWAETTPGLAKYYGVSNPVDIGSGDDDTVTLSMQQFGTASVFNLTYIDSTDTVVWNSIYGMTNYEFQGKDDAAPDFILIYFGNNPYYDYNTTIQLWDFRVRAHSSVFNLYSDFSAILDR